MNLTPSLLKSLWLGRFASRVGELLPGVAPAEAWRLAVPASGSPVFDALMGSLAAGQPMQAGAAVPCDPMRPRAAAVQPSSR